MPSAASATAAPATFTFVEPRESLADLAARGTAHLTALIAIDSASDERSPTIPSSPGQRAVIEHLRARFEALGFACEDDPQANLVVTIPARGCGAGAPRIAFMTHVDTSQGTRAVPRLEEVPAWQGARVVYPKNERLRVSADTYPETRCFLGDDLLHGPGEAPIGLDDKLGIAELVTLAEVLAANPAIACPETLLVFRPDEEIGRMGAVEGLAALLAARGVRYGYTNDGLLPFEINTENFNASRARVTIAGRPLALAPAAAARRVELSIHGVKSHGATAKSEGYRNATVIVAEALRALGDEVGDAIAPLALASSHEAEVDARLTLLVRGADPAALDAAQARALAALDAALEPWRWRGAGVQVTAREEVAPTADLAVTDAALRLVRHLDRFLRSDGPRPLLSEESEGYEGYTNPCFAEASADGDQVLVYRIRAFDPDDLARREEHVRALASADPAGALPVEVERQYINMGPALAPYPELVRFAEDALAPLGLEPRRLPIRGGTGVDPFLARGIPIANLGTGYFAPESEKELTSRQSLARHVLWLANLVQRIAHEGPSAAG